MKNRILSNTLYLYSRQIIIILITLYSMRVVLNELGIEDFGVYGVITGFVTLLAFLPGSMGAVTQRFFSYAIGENDDNKLKTIFSINLIIYIGMALIAYFLLKTIGFWYVQENLKLPDSRVQAAISLYNYSSLAFVVSIFTAPFISILIAHEDMHIYALLSVADALLKFIIVLSLAYTNYDKLVYYGLILLILSAFVAVSYIILCLRKYKECQLKKIYWNNDIFKEIIGFTWWTLFGQLSTAFRNQAVTVLINQIFNPATVAARIIALNVANQIAILATNLNTSLYPPIVKHYAAGENREMMSLIHNGSKLTFFLMWMFALPLIIKMDYILKLWLVNPPPQAVIFSRLAIIEGLIIALALPIANAARAPGKMALYEISLGSVQILIFFITYYFLKSGFSAEWVFYIAILANLLMFYLRLILVKYLIGFKIFVYFKNVLIPIFLVVIISTFVSKLLEIIIYVDNFYTVSLYIILSLLFSIILIYYAGLSKEWKSKVKNMVFKKFKRGKKI
ncbi:MULTISPECIES: oligosaccharide flippase family protein [unclassified Acinetobacter]|uniref:oligosaccharide flippase family protein n=1 Tax=unclassified Acinetobacter TaxID=196816 RepID=UPI0015D2BBC6|nr:MULTISPECIES: oligosaccharide flippase family protein [unclassified Acinetobacter]